MILSQHVVSLGLPALVSLDQAADDRVLLDKINATFESEVSA